MKRFLAAFLGLIAWAMATFAHAQQVHEIPWDGGNTPYWQISASHIQHEALVGFEWIDQPAGRIALIRMPNHLCAVKFLSFHTGHHVSKASMFHSEGVSQYAHALLIELPAHPSRAMLEQAEPRRISMSWHPLVGLGHMAIQRGHPYFRCAGVDIPWGYPTGIFLSQEKHGDLGYIQLAPTAWTSFADINLADPRLKWYSYDEDNDKVMAIPIPLLPGAKPRTQPVPTAK